MKSPDFDDIILVFHSTGEWGHGADLKHRHSTVSEKPRAQPGNVL